MAVTVTMLQTRRGEDGNLWTAGSSYSASDAFAQFLIASNLATGTLPQPPQTGLTAADQIAVKALVSGDGNVTAAALPNLVGVPNQTVRLSDGDDAGALLIWAIPEGSTSYTWCWHVWPKASYF